MTFHSIGANYNKPDKNNQGVGGAANQQTTGNTKDAANNGFNVSIFGAENTETAASSSSSGGANLGNLYNSLSSIFDSNSTEIASEDNSDTNTNTNEKSEESNDIFSNIGKMLNSILGGLDIMSLIPDEAKSALKEHAPQVYSMLEKMFGGGS